MGDTLEQLLFIQGATEQQSIETLINAPKCPQKRAQGADVEIPLSASQNAQEGHSKPKQGISPLPMAINASPAMLEAWRIAFKVFTKYAPALRQAASLDDNNEAAAKRFIEALEELNALFRDGGDSAILAARVYDMLDDVFKAAKGPAGA